MSCLKALGPSNTFHTVRSGSPYFAVTLGLHSIWLKRSVPQAAICNRPKKQRKTLKVDPSATLVLLRMWLAMVMNGMVLTVPRLKV